MSPGASKSRAGKRYLYYRCTNDVCTRKKKSIRAIVVFNFIYKLLEDGVGLTEKDYQIYHDNLTGQADKRRLTLKTDINSKEAALKATNRRIKELGLKLIDYKQDSPVWKVNNERILQLEADSKDLKIQVDELRAEQSDPVQELLSIEQFLNLAKNAGSKMKAADEVGKDHIARIIFLNLVVDDEKVMSYKMTKAFSKLEKAQNVLNGRRTDPLSEPVLDTLHSLLLNFTGIQSRLKSLKLLLEELRSKPATDLQFLL